MKKTGINPYDLFTLVLILALILTVILHTLMPKQQSERQTAKIELTAEKLKSTGEIPKEAYADGRFKFTVEAINKDKLFISCVCFCHNAGIMTQGGKLLCPNQPIELTSENFYVKGRITHIETFPFA